MNLSARYRDVSGILDALDFASLFPGFRRYSFALYSSREICLNGVLLPYNEVFRGNTSILYEGEYIAIWNLELDPVEDPERLACALVHEMFHCHQYAQQERRFPSDLLLLQSPADLSYCTRRFQENGCLADAYESADMAALGAFSAIREQRLRTYPAMVMQELKAETIEGTAEYVGLKALEQISRGKYRAEVQNTLQLLRAESRLQFDIRRVCYYAGALFLLCLERLGLELHSEPHSSRTVYEQNRIPPAALPLPRSYPALAQLCAALAQEQQALLDRHISRASYTTCRGRICGYDPMNMFRLGDRIYCSHFVSLQLDGQTQTFTRPIVLVLQEGSVDRVVGYY